MIKVYVAYNTVLNTVYVLFVRMILHTALLLAGIAEFLSREVILTDNDLTNAHLHMLSSMISC